MSEEELGTSVPQDNGDAAQAPADVAEAAEVLQEEEAPKSPLAETTRQWVSLPGSSCNVRIGSGNLENFGHDLKSSVGKPAKAALLVSDKADPDFVQELLWQLNDAGFQALRGSVPGEPTLSAADELFGELDRLHITSDDLIVCVGAAPELSLVLYAAGAWCGRTPVCALPLDLEALVCATVTPEGISVGTHRDMVSGHNSLKNVFADFARIDLGPSEKRLHAYATMVATAVSDTEKAFEALYNRRDALAEADEVALREQVNETLRSRGRIASSTSVAVRQSLSYGVTFAEALSHLVEGVPASTLLAEGLRFTARVAVTEEDFKVDDMLAQDELLSVLGLGTVSATVDPDALLHEMRACAHLRSNRFMLAVPRAFGRVRLATIEDARLKAHLEAWCAQHQAD